MPPSFPTLPIPRLHLFTRYRPRHNNNTSHTQQQHLRLRPTTQSHLFTTTTHPQETHYDTLSLPPNATPSDIKRQFFALSKLHHPDRNPSDPTASTRFVAISEAYHTLSVPEKRAKYDEEIGRSEVGGGRRSWGRSSYGGSYSSAQSSGDGGAFAGSRPASGLNKKRGTFRGPPPSFYKSGGYGEHGAKRAEHAYSEPHDSASSSSEARARRHSYGDFAGHGPGQTGHGHDVRHFDDARHKRTHDSVHEHIWARRRRNREKEVPVEGDPGGTLVRFLLVSGALVICGVTVTTFGDMGPHEQTRKEK